MLTKSLCVSLLVFIVIYQCSGRSVWQAIKDFKNTVIIPNEVIDMRTNAPWPICGREGDESNCRKKRDEEDVNKNNLTDTQDFGKKAENSTNLQDGETIIDNVTTIIGNTTFSTENIIKPNDSIKTESLTSTVVKSADNDSMSIEYLTSVENITDTNNITITISNTTRYENGTQLIDNFTITTDDEMKSIEYTNASIDNINQLTDNTTVIDETTLQTEEMKNNSKEELTTDEITNTGITEKRRRKRQNIETDIRNNSESIVNYQNSSTAENISETILESKNYSSINSISEDVSNTSTILLNLNGTDNENLTIELESSMIENDLLLNETEPTEDYNTFDYNENSTIVYSSNSTDNLTLNENVTETFNSQLNETITKINESVSTITENITTPNEENNNNPPKIESTSFSPLLATQINDRKKREISLNITSSNLGTKFVNISSNATYNSENLNNPTFSVNATSKTESTNGSISPNETALNSATTDNKQASTIEKVCLIQGEACVNSSQCCENFECTMFDIIKWSSNCDFKPSDPQMITPLTDVRIPKKFAVQPSLKK